MKRGEVIRSSMKNEAVLAGGCALREHREAVGGQFVDLAGETYYRIANYDRMRPFLMSIVSDSDIWMFVSSSGGLTAGRKNPDHALFPYYTDDKLHDAQDLTGSKTLVLIDGHQTRSLWEPFSDRYRGIYDIRRHLYKNVYGNKVRFEEINRDLGLAFTFTWCNSERFGVVKHATLRNLRDEAVSVTVLDGV